MKRALAPSLALVALLAGGTARAADYGYFIEIETEDELLDLLASGEIDDSTFQVLQDLLNDGVNLVTADREELYSLPNLTYEEVDKLIKYRELAGPIQDAASLVAAEILSQKKLLAITPFIILGEPGQRFDAHGRLSYRAAYVVGDGVIPPMWLGARVTTLKRQIDIGIIGMLTRNELTDVRWDSNRGALSAGQPSLKLRVPKFHVQYKTQKWHIVAGTFRIGFGQRLVIDNSNQYTPNGIRVDDQVQYSRDVSTECREATGDLPAPCAAADITEYQAPDFRSTVRFRGIAVGLRSAEIGKGWLSAHAFASYETKGIYQYELYDRARCPDPRDDNDPRCAAPYVYVTQHDPLAPTTRFKFTTLPLLYNELTSGGNISYFFSRRAHVGLTGYGAKVYWLTEGANLDFQEWARTPFGGPFGAVGVDMAWGAKWFDLFAEVARSIDNQPGGGGTAAIVRATASLKKQEIELSARYYDPSFNNPYARPISAIGEFDGLSATNEAGVRLKHSGHFGDLDLSSTIDLWWSTHQTSFSPLLHQYLASQQVPQAFFRIRGEYEVVPWFLPSVWINVLDKDISQNGRGQCFTTPFEEVEGEPIPCAGMRALFGLQLHFLPRRGINLTLRYAHQIRDDRKYPDGFRQDMNATINLAWKAREWLILRTRLRYLSQDIVDAASLEESIWAYLESTFVVKKTLRIKLRYEVQALIDKRKGTALREPNPAHWLRLEMEYRF